MKNGKHDFCAFLILLMLFPCSLQSQNAISGIVAIEGQDLGDVPPQPGEDRWSFVEDLKAPMWTRHPWGTTHPLPSYADLSRGVRLKFEFADPEGRLETAHLDLRRFLAAGGISCENEGYTIETRSVPDLGREAFQLEIWQEACLVRASDTEGIRRGIFYIEDEMLRLRGPFLRHGMVERRPFIQRRISRCFFGPIKRPPRMRDELMDDVDYYPDEYLNRLAHEGINGLWLTIEFRDLARTTFTPEAGQDARKRLLKLRRTVAKCMRYGIRTYIFCIEPRAWDADNPVLTRYPELAGSPAGNNKLCFCPGSETARRYLYESVNGIFKSVPGLGGIINITHGERPTTCLSAVSAVGEGRISCPRCSSKAPWEILHESLSAMERGMHEAAPDAELISWLYMPQARGALRDGLADWVYDIPAHTPNGVILQFNFESGVRRTMFGKELTGGDYWISTPGPSERFERIAGTALENGIPVSAKIQTGSSHEVATVPYVPVPSLLYRKFAGMRRLGVTHTMLCWYFGNYPGMMNKAAGELSFEPFPENEDAFLRRLASLYWGEKDAPQVAEAWKRFAEGYENYPLTNLFQYYGPMHDGPVWPLHLKPVDTPLSPTWLLGSTATGKPWPPSGDRIGECIMEALTLDEAVEAARRMSAGWDSGLAILRGLEPHFSGEPERLLDIGVARALGIQFRSGYNILRFYRMREEMLRMEGRERLVVLEEMSGIIREELSRDEELLSLCERDSRLGFHSEAEGYKYFPEKIRWRMGLLQNLLGRDAPQVEQMIRNNESLFPAYTGESPAGAVARCMQDGNFQWQDGEPAIPAGLDWQLCAYGGDSAAMRWGASSGKDALYVFVTSAGPGDRRLSASAVSRVLVRIEPRRLWPCRHFIYIPGASSRAGLPDEVAPESVEGRVIAGPDAGCLVVRIPLERIGLAADRLHPIRLDVQVVQGRSGAASWRPGVQALPRLRLGSDDPSGLGWLLFAK